jgi:hypothetical protein
MRNVRVFLIVLYLFAYNTYDMHLFICFHHPLSQNGI